MRVALLEYSSFNIGDDLQSLALERALPTGTEITYIDREAPGPASAWDDDVCWIVNGWWGGKVWPIKTGARVLVVGYHSHNQEAIPRAHQPIGCRDIYTEKLCKDHGVKCWLSYCSTLLFEKSDKARDGGVVLVDVPLSVLPEGVRPRHVITHQVPEDRRRDRAFRRQKCLDVLDIYSRAELVVTNRLHVALPCMALGTPVALTEPEFDPRRLNGYRLFFYTLFNGDKRFIKLPTWNRPKPLTGCDTVKMLIDPFRAAMAGFVRESS